MVTLVNQYFSLLTHADLQLSFLSVANTRLTGTQIRVYLLAAGRAQIKVNSILMPSPGQSSLLRKQEERSLPIIQFICIPSPRKLTTRTDVVLEGTKPLVAVNSDVD